MHIFLRSLADLLLALAFLCCHYIFGSYFTCLTLNFNTVSANSRPFFSTVILQKYSILNWVLKLNLENGIFLMLKSLQECFFYFFLFSHLSLSLSQTTCFIYFWLWKWGANPLPLIALHLSCFFNYLFLLWLIHDGPTLCNLLKIKEIACFFYLIKNQMDWGGVKPKMYSNVTFSLQVTSATKLFFAIK